jgi:hypothetical protein
MKLTGITDAERALVGTVRGHHSGDPADLLEEDLVGERGSAGARAAPVRMDGQTFHQIEVPDEWRALADVDELHARVRDYLSQRH